METENTQQDHHFSPDHPIHPSHEAHPDNEPLRVAHPRSNAVRAFITLHLLFIVVITVILGIKTNAPFGNVMLALLPSLLFPFIAAGLLAQDHFDEKYVAFAGIMLIMLHVFTLLFIPVTLDIAAVTGLNILFCGILLLVIGYAMRPVVEYEEEIEEFEPEEVFEIPDMIAAFDLIREKSKLINVAIGRVYDVADGGSAALRSKIRIDSEDYNSLQPDKKPEALVETLLKILARVELITLEEKGVFTLSELDRLHDLNRSSTGRSSIVDVLANNEGEHIRVAHGELYELIQSLLSLLTPHQL